MALLKNLLGNDKNDDRAETIRALLEELQQERLRFQALLDGSGRAAERLTQLGEPIAQTESAVSAMNARLAELEQRFASLAPLADRFAALDERAQVVTQSQQETQAVVADVAAEAERVRSTFADIGQKIERVLGLQEQMSGFVELDDPFQQLRGQVEGVRGQVDATAELLARLREQHDRLLDMHKVAVARMEALDRRRDDLGRDLTDKERRVAGVDQAIRGLDGIQESVDEVRREMGTLKALGEFLTEKTVALEAQRGAVESALAGAERLERAMAQIDVGVRQQKENERSLTALQDQVTALRSLHETVVERSAEISQLQREADAKAQASREELAAVREEMKKTIDRFDFESRGLESVSQRVHDLRTALSDFEHRFKGLTESSQTVLELKAQTNGLETHLQTLSAEAVRVDQEMAKLQTIRRDLDETSRMAREAREDAVRIEQAAPAVAEALRDVEQLRAAHALVRDSLERSQLAHEEVTRLWEGQTETRTWLTGVGQTLEELRERVTELQRLSPAIEAVQGQAQRVTESVASIEARREFVEDLHRRVADLGALGGQLDERTRQILARMDAAEKRFVGLGEHSEEAERMAQTIAAIVSGVEDAGRRSEEIGKTVAVSQARCEAVEALADRTRGLKKELDQRRRALEETTKDLQQVTELRRDAAASAQQLDELAKRLTASVTSADQRASQVDALAAQLEDRATSLALVEKRLGQFEERLVRWELSEQQIIRSLEQISARQGTIESLQADLDRMVVMAEKTAADVRSITSSNQEIEESRALLEDVMGRLRQIQDVTKSLDERKRQMAKAEERLARADALLTDVRSSLEALQGQKVLVDQAVEKAGSLRTLLKQAEVTIESLRDERKMTARVRAAVTDLAQDDEGPEMAKAA